MYKILRLTLSLSLLVASLVSYGQGRIITGRVTSSEDGSSLPGVNVVVKGTTNGTVTNSDGYYQLQVPATGGSLMFSFIGFQAQEVPIGDRSSIDVSLGIDVTQLSEIVVTGVAEGTSVRKLGFALGKVNTELLQEVPAVDAANALRGKVSGLQVIQGNGVQGSAASIRLRGATSISNNVNQEPLIIIDGTITPPGSSSLADINMNDVESIEVVKGAAGAALYGSLAGNGVIQIITKRGSKNEKTVFTLRNEYGVSSLQRKMPVNQHHNFELDTNGEFVLDASGNPIDDAEAILDNSFPVAYDQQERLFKNNANYTNYFSVSSRQGKTSFFSSVDNSSQGGIIDGVRSFDRQNVRLNVDHFANDRFKLSTSTLYSYSEGPVVASQGEQGGIVYDIIRLSPGQDALASNFDGQPFKTTSAGGVFNTGRNSNNPLYTAHNDHNFVERERILGNFSGSYELYDWWKLDAQLSVDRATRKRDRFRDKKYLLNGASLTNPYTNSLILKSNLFTTSKVYSATSHFNKQFGELRVGLSLRYQAEDYTTSFSDVQNTNSIVVDGINQVENIPSNAITVSSFDEIFRAENYFGNLKLDYAGKYLVDALIRRDASSLFGVNEREQLFYRVSGAYRISEDFKIPGIQELKLRASIGTSGQRPPYEAQYEAVPLLDGNYTLGNGTKGNANLKPSTITEFETGINVDFLNRFSFEANYAKSNAEDQILLVPLSATSGFSSQWQNAGSVESETFEFSLNSEILKTNKLGWNVGIVGSRSVSKVTKLNRAPFGYKGGTVGTGDIFLIKEGENLGVIYGGVIASNLNELTIGEDGFVDNLEGITGRTLDDFTVNRDGFVILDGTEFTAAERPYNLIDPTSGARINKKIGDGTPDFILGVNTTLSYRGLSLYVLVDAQIGGDIANVNKQNMMFNEVAEEVDQSGYPVGERKYPQYFNILSNSGSAPNQYFIEDGSYTTLREISLSYGFNKQALAKLGKTFDFLDRVKVSVSGRNLLTISNYSGWTPEVAASGGLDGVGTNPFNFRADYGAVPLYRSFNVALELTF